MSFKFLLKKLISRFNLPKCCIGGLMISFSPHFFIFIMSLCLIDSNIQISRHGVMNSIVTTLNVVPSYVNSQFSFHKDPNIYMSFKRLFLIIKMRQKIFLTFQRKSFRLLDNYPFTVRCHTAYNQHYIVCVHRLQSSQTFWFCCIDWYHL